MDITIIMLNGTSHHPRVNPQDTVSSLKTLIQRKLGVPVQEQKLVFVNGQRTSLNDDSKPLSSYGLQSGSQVSLLITQPQPVQVFLKYEKGKLTTYDIKPDETVDNFKARVEQREGVPVSQQRLLHQGREMTTGRLTDYNVTNHSTIQLMSMLITQLPPIQVFLRNEKGKSTTYDITSEETVDHFKAKVEQREEVPVRQQRLLHESREMTTGRLTDYNVTNHSTIHLMSMLVTQRPPIQVFLRNEKGKLTTYDIKPDETVDHFKARVQQREEVPVSQQRLLHQSREMTTGRLTDYNVTNHSTIHLMSMLVTQRPPIQVFLWNEKGKSTTYDITSEETVDHFKAKVEQREEVPVRQQRLLHESREMTTGRLTDYNVTNHSTIHLMSMLVTQRPPIQVFLRNEKGKLTTYDIKPDETVDHFKARVQRREGIPVSQQRLLHQSREMMTGRLTDYNVTNHSTIDLMLRLRGG